MIGTPQGDEIKDPSREFSYSRVEFAFTKINDTFSPELESLPDIFNDLDVDFSANPKAAIAYLNDQRNIRKVREHTKKLQINIIHPLREGKRLLVLDIDYSEHPLVAPGYFLDHFYSDIGYKALDIWGFTAS